MCTRFTTGGTADSAMVQKSDDVTLSPKSAYTVKSLSAGMSDVTSRFEKHVYAVGEQSLFRPVTVAFGHVVLTSLPPMPIVTNSPAAD